MGGKRIKTAGIVGGGVIGAGWAARMVLNGIDVQVFDPDPEIGRKLDAVIGNARRAYARLFPGLALAEGRVTIAATVEAAVRGANFVQESLPEREDLKRRVLAQIDGELPADVVIGSSTSGLLPTRLQADMAHPERLVVGHPFNPVYLLPLVEICGGEKTSEAARETAARFYASIGMHPLHVRKEIDGFIADRLLEALWREALWLVNDGIATTAEIDDAVRYGAGLRWSFMGTFLTYRLAGGEAGMRHFLAQFGPALKLPWTKLEAPELTQALIDAVAVQSDDQAGGVSIRELEALRDDCLVSVLAGLRSVNYGAGAVVRGHHHALAAALPTAGPSLQASDGPLVLHRVTVPADWIDYNGHMTEYRYLQVFGDATDALLRHIGIDQAYLASAGSYYTVESHIIHRGETKAAEALHVTTQILSVDAKRLHLFHRIVRSRDDFCVASAEQMLLHVEAATGRTGPAGTAILDRLNAIAQDHREAPLPQGAGRAVGRATG